MNNNWLISMKDCENVDKAIRRIRDYELIQKIMEYQTLEDLIKKSKTKENVCIAIGTVIGLLASIRFIKKIKSTISRNKQKICITVGMIATIAIAIFAFFKYNNK